MTPFEKRTKKFLEIDETIVKSFGAIPIDFDEPKETVDYARDLVMRRGVI